MITRKELEYVNTWARKTPYPGNDYSEEALEKLRTAYNLFNEIYKGNKYNIILSNNEELDLQIQDKNLAHMLGIDYQNLTNPIFDEFRKKVLDLDPSEQLNSYRFLEAILNNSDKVIDFDANGYLRALNYYKISIKSDIFNKLGNMINFGNGCISFDKTEYLKNSGFGCFNPNSTKFLYVPSDEAIAPYFFMGICPTNNEISNDLEDDSFKIKTTTPYFVETLFAPDKPEYFFDNQEVVIPTQILKINDKEMIKFSASPSQKKKVLKEYDNIIQQYNLKNNMNIYADYIASLSEEEKKLTKSL